MSAHLFLVILVACLAALLVGPIVGSVIHRVGSSE